MKKRLISLLLTVVMLLSLVVVPANADLVSGTGTLTITPNVTSVPGSDSAPIEVIYTIKVTPPAEGPVGEFHFNLKAPDGMTLADAEGEQGKEGYWVNPTLSYHKTYNKEGIFETFEYTPASKYFQAAGTNASRNMTAEAEIMTIKATIAAGKVGDFTLTAENVGINKDGTDSYSVDVKTTPVTITKAPISSVTASVETPVAGKSLDFNGTVDSGAPYSISKVEWFEGTNASGPALTNPTTAKSEQFYYARITLTANSGETFAEKFKTGAANGDYSVYRNSDTELYLTKAYDKTGSLPAASVTDAPKANTGLKYNGGEQDLLGFVGTANGGTMQYSLDNSNWSTAIPKGKNAGDYTVYYKAVGDGGHSDSAVAHISAKIEPKDISGVTSVSIVDQPYTGSAITPDPEVKDGGTTLVKGKDYTVASSSKYVGTATLTITGKGNYTGTKDANFAITAVYQNPSFTTPVDLATGGARLDLRTLVQNAKGDMIFTITSGNAAILSGHELTSTGTTGVVKIKVSIAAKDMNGDTINEYNAFSKSEAITVNVINKTTNTTAMKVSQGDITYGETVSPSVDNKPADAGEVSYTYEVFDGTTYNSTTAPTNVGKYKVKAKCESSTTIYTAEDDFEILPKSISGMTVNLNKTTTVYDGNTQTVTVTGVGSLTAADYDVTSGTSDENVGNYTVKVTGKGNYEGTATATWEITPATLTVTPVANQSKKFKEADPALTYNCSGNVSGQIPAFGGKLNRAEGEGAGMYAIELGDLALKDNGTFKASNYELKMASPAVKFEIKKADALTLEDITLNQKCNVTTEQSKDIGTAGMPADAGALTYAKGTEGKTGSVAIDSWNVDPTTGKVTYKLSNGAVGDTVTLPVTIKSTNYADSTVNVVITLIKGSSGGYYYAPTTAVVPDMPMLYRGCTGDAVKTLQDKLNALGYNSGNVDGIFGSKTKAAVLAFQKANGLGVDGIVGPLTWAKLG